MNPCHYVWIVITAYQKKATKISVNTVKSHFSEQKTEMEMEKKNLKRWQFILLGFQKKLITNFITHQHINNKNNPEKGETNQHVGKNALQILVSSCCKSIHLSNSVWKLIDNTSL